jgi:hypothetical protein
VPPAGRMNFGICRFRNSSNSGTVNAVSPYRQKSEFVRQRRDAFMLKIGVLEITHAATSGETSTTPSGRLSAAGSEGANNKS